MLSLLEKHRYHKNNTIEKRELKIKDLVLIQTIKSLHVTIGKGEN